MIKVKMIDAGAIGGRLTILVADTKDEVPATGAATIAAMGNERPNVLSMGDVIYTTDLTHVASLKSDDTWNWGD